MIDGALSFLLQFMQNISAKLLGKSGSALNPFLKYCVIISTPCFVLTWLTRDYTAMSYLFMVIGAIPVVTTCIVGLRFAFKNPTYLRSERHELQRQKLNLNVLIKKGEPKPIDLASTKSIPNPTARRPKELAEVELTGEEE